MSHASSLDAVAYPLFVFLIFCIFFAIVAASFNYSIPYDRDGWDGHYSGYFKFLSPAYHYSSVTQPPQPPYVPSPQGRPLQPPRPPYAPQPVPVAQVVPGSSDTGEYFSAPESVALCIQSDGGMGAQATRAEVYQRMMSSVSASNFFKTS